MTTEEQNWYTFSSKLNTFLIDKGYKMEYSNNCRQFCLGNIPHFIIDYEDQLIHFNQDLYSSWYRMSFNNYITEGEYKPDFNLLAQYADEILTQYKQQVLVNKLLRIQNDF